MVEIVGGVLGADGLTVTVKAELVLFVPSLTETVICALPVWFAAGVTLTVRLDPLPPNTMFALGTSVVEEEVPDTVKRAAAVSASATVNGIAAVAWFAVTVCAAIPEIVGALLTVTCWMLNVKLEFAVFVPSLTVTVIRVLPTWLKAGVMVSVRFWPLPPSAMFALGTNVVEEEVAETIKLAADVSASLTVKGIAAVVWFKVPA